MIASDEPGVMIDHLVVVVPARNEQELVGRCITSLVRARRALDPTVTCSIVVVADQCTDDTALVARSYAGAGVEVIESPHGCVGLARQVGVTMALGMTDGGCERVWICSTDADSSVPPDWLTMQLEIAGSGAPAIAGIVDLDEAADDELRSQFCATYTLHPDGSHPHVHAANLGVRADVYLDAGGWRAHETGEEHDLWRRIRTFAQPVSTTRLRVSTASRLHGRAPHGFADDLAALVDPREAAA